MDVWVSPWLLVFFNGRARVTSRRGVRFKSVSKQGVNGPRGADARAPTASPTIAMADCGVLQTIYTDSNGNAENLLAYVRRAAGLTRRNRAMLLPYPLALAAVRHTFGLLNGSWSHGVWDQHLVIDPLPVLNDAQRGLMLGPNGTTWMDLPFAAWKLLGLLSSPFTRTLYLDLDVFLLDRRLAPSLLERTLRLADVAMPMEASRAAFAGDYWQEEAGMGQLCSALMVYRRNRATDALFRGALSQLLVSQYPKACVDYTPAHNPKNLTKYECNEMRQGDQEYIMLEWIRAADPALRVVALPEEFYCPGVRLKGANARSLHADWATPYNLRGQPKGLRCRSVHGRFLLNSDSPLPTFPSDHYASLV